MQTDLATNEVGGTEAVETIEAGASAEELGLEIVEDTPQISLARPVRHIRR